MRKYYSALDKEDTSKAYLPVERVSVGNSVAFLHNIEKQFRLPSEYDDCDLLYTDIPWRAGYEKFNKWAGIEGSGYKNFIRAVSEIIIQNKDKAIVIVCGKPELKMLPIPDKVIPVDLNKFPSQGVLYGIKWLDKVTSTEQLLEMLAHSRFKKIGDFCCGYGSAGRHFAQAGKDFVMSDINPRCIGYIKEELPNWLPEHPESIKISL